MTEELLLDIVKERGVFSMIMEEKKKQEWQDLIESNGDDWDSISINQKLSEDFIREFKDKVHFDWISRYQTLSEDFIRSCQLRVYWRNICQYQKLSCDFMKEMKNMIDLRLVSEYQDLTEDFIRENKGKLEWGRMLRHQKFSYEFVKELCFDKDLELETKNFLEYSIITLDEVASIEDSNIIHNRLEILDI